MKSYLIGFDAREMFVDFSTWTLYQKDTFLLRTDIVKPLSVDRYIWKSFFSDRIGPEFEEQKGWQQGTSSDLLELKEQISRNNIEKSKFWIIAITQFINRVSAESEAMEVFPINPSEIDPTWRFLGYDIANQDPLSALMDMGYGKDESVDARAAFGPLLNEYHLFSAYEDAVEFQDLAYHRDLVHSPYYVYGIYLVEELG